MQISILTSVEQARAVYPEVAALFRTCFQRDPDTKRWAQYYFLNPYGDPLVTLARNSEGTLIGHSGMIPQQLVDRNGESYPYCLSISLMVDPRHREGFTTFYTLFGAATNAAHDRNVPFLLAFPNATSFLLLKHGFGWRELAESGLYDWKPAPLDATDTLIEPLERFRLGNESGHPEDATYRSWRNLSGPYRVELINQRLEVIYRRTADQLLTILDLNTEHPEHAPDDLRALAARHGATTIRISGIHAQAAGLRESQLIPHGDYRLRLCYAPLTRHPPQPRFSLLLSDVF